MNVAVASDEASLGGMIGERFAEAKMLLIIGMDDDPESANIKKCIQNCSGADMARAAAAENCEAVISGVLEPDAFNILADEQITRFDGSGMTVLRV
jgi:predicted Fe-Mo cluster-binding NifX family protein